MDYVDNCDKDIMSLIELDHMLFQLGYKDCVGYYYANKNEELIWCLTDETVLEICSSLSKDEEVETCLSSTKRFYILFKVRLGLQMFAISLVKFYVKLKTLGLVYNQNPMWIKHLNMKIKVDQIIKRLGEIYLEIMTLLMMDI